MSKRKRHKRPRQRQGGAADDPPKRQKEQPFFRPFQQVAKTLSQADKSPPEEPKRPPQAEPAAPETDEMSMFQRAMAGVTPMVDASPDRVPPPKPQQRAEPKVVDDDREALLELSEFVAGQRPFDIVDTDEHVDGAVQGLDPRILRRLRKGDYSVAAHIDLHGQTRDEARAELTRFVSQSRLKGLRCVLVVHGRGLHSKDQRPVLKEAIVKWLGRTGLRKQILAFCTARPYDGGAGALYVLLRR